MAITTSSHPKALWPGIKEWFGLSYKAYDTEYDKLFTVESSSKAYEEFVGQTGLGLAQIKPEGQAVSYDDMSQGFITRFTHVRYALGFIITHEAMADNLYMKVGKNGATALGRSMRETREIVGANVYNRAFSGSYLGGDGVSMCNASHPNFTGGTQDNVASAALSEAALEQAVIDMAAWTDDRGLLVNYKPTQLIVPPALMFEARRILDSEGRTTAALVNSTEGSGFTSGATNDINAFNAMGYFSSYTVNHYLTSGTAWFLRTDCPTSLLFLEREALALSDDSDFDNENAKYKATDRYSCGWVDWRGIYGSTGS